MDNKQQLSEYAKEVDAIRNKSIKSKVIKADVEI
jgi:hypothetical protein